MKMANAVIRIFVMFPIWMWLVYQVLTRVQATELMWFLYWAYVPISIVSITISEAIRKDPK